MCRLIYNLKKNEIVQVKHTTWPITKTLEMLNNNLDEWKRAEPLIIVLFRAWLSAIVYYIIHCQTVIQTTEQAHRCCKRLGILLTPHGFGPKRELFRQSSSTRNLPLTATFNVWCAKCAFGQTFLAVTFSEKGERGTREKPAHFLESTRRRGHVPAT